MESRPGQDPKSEASETEEEEVQAANDQVDHGTLKPYSVPLGHFKIQGLYHI